MHVENTYYIALSYSIVGSKNPLNWKFEEDAVNMGVKENGL
jgi:hypothetical protein